MTSEVVENTGESSFGEAQAARDDEGALKSDANAALAAATSGTAKFI